MSEQYTQIRAKLEELKELLADELITQEDYEKQKNILLEQLTSASNEANESAQPTDIQAAAEETDPAVAMEEVPKRRVVVWIVIILVCLAVMYVLARFAAFLGK